MINARGPDRPFSGTNCNRSRASDLFGGWNPIDVRSAIPIRAGAGLRAVWLRDGLDGVGLPIGG